MLEMKEFEVLGYTANAVIARFLERHFPGVLIQGDTLKIFLDDIEDLRNEAAAGNLETVEEIADMAIVKKAAAYFAKNDKSKVDYDY